MKVKTDHNFYIQPFNRMLEILSTDYTIKKDDTESFISPTLYLTNKKYKTHGIRIQTHNNSTAEYDIGMWYDIPIMLKPGHSPRYAFTVPKGDNGFPEMDKKLADTILPKIQEMEKYFLEEVQEYFKDFVIDDDHWRDFKYTSLGIKNIQNYVEIDLDKVMERSIHEAHSFQELTHVIQMMINTSEVHKYIDKAVWLLTAMIPVTSFDIFAKFARELYDKNIYDQFNESNMKYFVSQVNRAIDVDVDSVDRHDLMAIENFIGENNSIDMRVHYYELTGDEHALPETVKDIFLF